MVNCEGCGENISPEEKKAGSRNGLCVVCEFIRPTIQERIARKEFLQKQRMDFMTKFPDSELGL